MLKNKFKILIFVLSLLFTVNSAYAVYDMTVPLEGNSIANDTLQSQVLKDIYPLSAKMNPVCLDHRVVNTQLIHYPYDVVKKNNKYVKGYWKELWTIEYCGKRLQVPITFKINKKTITYTIEKMGY